MAFTETTRKPPPGVALDPGAGETDLDAETIGEDAAELSEDEPLAPREEPQYGTDKDRLVAWVDDDNLARYLNRSELNAIGTLVVREYEIDKASRSDWEEEAKGALDFATQTAEPKNYPWVGCSNIVYPLITTAAFQFSAITYPAIIDHQNVAKGQVIGSDDGTPATKGGDPKGVPETNPDGSLVWLTPPGDKQRRADLIGEHMSYQILEQMEEWEPQTDAGLMQMPILGGFVRKTFRDPVARENRSLTVSLLDLVWNKNAPSFERAPRHTEELSIYPDEIESKERADETFLHYSYGPEGAVDADGTAEDPADSLAPLKFLEQHRRYDLDGDGYAEPLIITVHKQTQRVVRIVARYEREGIDADQESGEIIHVAPVEYYTLYPFLPNPKGGSIPVGFGHLLKPLNEAINTTLNQMFDAGHLQIAGGGFVGDSLSIHTGKVLFEMGEYKPVRAKGQAIRDAVYPIPWPGPSPVLFEVLGFLVQAAKETASIQNILSGDATLANVQPTTLLALIEQGMKLYTAIYKRIYRSLKKELQKLYRLNRLYIEGDERFKIGDAFHTITSDDYRLGGGVVPAADPNMVTDMQKITRAVILAGYQNDPLCNPVEIRRRIFEAARIEHPEKVLAQQPAAPPPDKQLEMANLQADLGRKHAAETKDATQAMLNLAMARKFVTEAQLEHYDRLTELIRVHVEALNTQVKAADVDAKFHGHNVRMKQAGREAADAGSQAQDVAKGGGAAAESALPGTGAGNLPDVAPPPGNGGVSAVPGGPGGQLPPGPSAGLGGQPGP